jgi:GAF domain-containing protein
VVALILAVADADVVAIALGPVCVLALIKAMRRWGVAYGVPLAMAALLAYDWYVIPPTHGLDLPDAANLGDLLVYLGIAALIGALAADAGRRASVSEEARSELAAEQAALRRVATLVAHRADPRSVFAAVTREVGELLAVDAAYMGRYDADTVTGVASWSRDGEVLPLGTRKSVEGDSVTALVRRTARPARIDSYDAASGPIAGLLRAAGMRSSAGAPIIVDGALWGVIIASTKGDEPLPRDTESRMAGFTELAATAISNTEAWAEAQRLADEQTSLRRVATLVAREAPPLIIQAGTHEVLLDAALRLASRAATADVEVTLEITPRVPHVFQAYHPILDEAAVALDRAGQFLSAHLAGARRVTA